MPAAIKDADSTKEAQLLESWKAYKKGFQEGIALFNKKPKKGVAFMQVRDCTCFPAPSCNPALLHVHICITTPCSPYSLTNAEEKLSEVSPVTAVGADMHLGTEGPSLHHHHLLKL